MLKHQNKPSKATRVGDVMLQEGVRGLQRPCLIIKVPSMVENDLSSSKVMSRHQNPNSSKWCPNGKQAPIHDVIIHMLNVQGEKASVQGGMKVHLISAWYPIMC
jgi:hypothetical protein